MNFKVLIVEDNRNARIGLSRIFENIFNDRVSITSAQSLIGATELLQAEDITFNAVILGGTITNGREESHELISVIKQESSNSPEATILYLSRSPKKCEAAKARGADFVAIRNSGDVQKYIAQLKEIAIKV